MDLLFQNLVSVFKKQQKTNAHLLKRKLENSKAIRDFQDKFKKLQAEHNHMQCFDEPIVSR